MISNNVILLVWYSMVCLVSVKITNGRSNIPSLICKTSTFASLGFLLQLIMMRHKSEIACAPLWKVHKTTALTLQISTYAFICLSRDSCTCTSSCLEYFPKKMGLAKWANKGTRMAKGAKNSTNDAYNGLEYQWLIETKMAKWSKWPRIKKCPNLGP